jgi:hypothetical protein
VGLSRRDSIIVRSCFADDISATAGTELHNIRVIAEKKLFKDTPLYKTNSPDTV